MKFHLYRDRKGKLRWRLKARNGRIRGDSGEGYNTRRALDAALAAIRVGARTAPTVDHTIRKKP